MLRNALEGSGGMSASTAYSEAFRLIMRSAAGDKSFAVRIASARCLKAFASIGGPGLGVTELENSASYCVKAGILSQFHLIHKLTLQLVGKNHSILYVFLYYCF
jgi:hypothetical protein